MANTPLVLFNRLVKLLYDPMPAVSSDDRLDLVFHALSDRTRRAILKRLARGPVMVTGLAAPFEMSLAAVSKHVKVLERARLVKRTIDGRVHHCALRGAGLRDAEVWLGH
jgi:DNA-binding transcriptional ArsR family regulator